LSEGHCRRFVQKLGCLSRSISNDGIFQLLLSRFNEEVPVSAAAALMFLFLHRRKVGRFDKRR
jgi:hypothetical protein